MAPTSPYNDPNRIVRSFVNPNGGTAECMCYQTADGRIWQEKLFPQESTATTIGRLSGDRIVPSR